MKSPTQSGNQRVTRDFGEWQALLRHETLQRIKFGTFIQLIACPELKDLFIKSISENDELLKLLRQRLESNVP
ncbi:hypothetical protein [Paenibacillus chibensis]|uniref:hypothetical protein n=1 Tax=Paenibacillus chibensis TaxID=59846 RepID=UPI000FDB0D3E|nr:hypothetical protein [Paenibacillus chibensis]MEC0373427.1 hypothetical protein [Paenibacillus chibensis]